MPSHQERVRRSGLPQGYQFGDAGRIVDRQLGIAIRFVKAFDVVETHRSPVVVDALSVQACDHRVRYDVMRNEARCWCGFAHMTAEQWFGGGRGGR